MHHVLWLADTQAGEKPLLLRLETVAHLSAPKVFVVAGDSWNSIDLPVSSYELVYRDHVAVLETAFNADIAKSMGATMFDSAAYSRMSGALARAALIVVTHEHPDHVGGLLAQPNLKELLATTRLTREQVAELRPNLNVDSFALLHLAPNVFDGYRPLDYVRYLPLAPGVVLIKSPGHTPGSQMVYVRRADGVEFLFLGDVAWSMRNVEIQREKARLVVWVAGEDRPKVREELFAPILPQYVKVFLNNSQIGRVFHAKVTTDLCMPAPRFPETTEDYDHSQPCCLSTYSLYNQCALAGSG